MKNDKVRRPTAMKYVSGSAVTSPKSLILSAVLLNIVCIHSKKAVGISKRLA
jgi:hypothetical protein